MRKSLKTPTTPGRRTGPKAAVLDKRTSTGRQQRKHVQSFAALTVTTRKTIEVPEDYFYKVKLRAVERRMLEKELWGEIVREYFENHPQA